MTGRDKILAAFSESGTPHTSVVLCYPEIFLRDHWEEVNSEPWWRIHDPAPDTAVAVQRNLLRVTGEDRYSVRPGVPRDQLTRYRLEGNGDTARLIDTVTGEVKVLLRPPPGGFVSYNDSGLNGAIALSSHEQIDALLPLPPEETPETLAADGRDETPRRLHDAFGPEKMACMQVSTPLDPLQFVLGFTSLMTSLIDTPDLVRYAAERSLACQLRRIRTAQAIGVELIFLQECSADQMSPEMYGRIFFPLLQELTRAIHDSGMKSIHYCTGNPQDRLELLLKSGADALALEESKKGFMIDLADVARQCAGRMALVGNLDAIRLLEHGSDEDLRMEIARQLEAGRQNDGRFIFGIGSPVTPGTPAARVRRMVDMVHELAP